MSPYLQSTETFQLVEEAKVPEAKEASATPSPGRDFWHGVGPNRVGGPSRNLEQEMHAAQALSSNQGGTAPNQGTGNAEQV